MHQAKTETISAALRQLASEIQAPDDVPAMALIEAAQRLDELAEENTRMREALASD